MSEENSFTITMEQKEGFEFIVKFDKAEFEKLVMDEPEPLGTDRGPNASRILAAAVGNCLSASLLFCLQKAKVEPLGIHASVKGIVGRNEKKRMRVERIEALLTLNVTGEQKERLGRCLDLFEDFCVVSASVRQGIPMVIRVEDQEGNVLK